MRLVDNVTDKKLAIVIANYNGSQDTMDCLESLSKSDFKDFFVVLVDDASHKEEVDKIQNELMHGDGQGIEIILLINESNLGFAGANNVGISKALTCNPEYVMLLNNDTTVEPDTLSNLMAKASSNTLVSPKILYSVQPDRIWFAGGYIDDEQMRAFHIGMGKKDSPVYDVDEDCDVLTFCAVVIPSKAFEQVGFLDEQLYMYCEDVDYSIRARKLGYNLRYIHNARVFHKEGASTGGFQSTRSVYYSVRNECIIRDRYFKNGTAYNRSLLGITKKNNLIKRLSLMGLNNIEYWKLKGLKAWSKGETGRLDVREAVWDKARNSSFMKNFYFGPCKRILRRIKWRIAVIRAGKMLNTIKHEKFILYVFNELKESGAPLMLLDIIEKDKKEGYKGVAVSVTDGPLRSRLEEKGLSVHICYGNTTLYKKILSYGPSKVWLNTIVTKDYLRAIPSDIPVKWWIHESYSLLPDYAETLPKKLGDNVEVLYVSERVREAAEASGLDWNGRIMHYRMPEVNDAIVQEPTKPHNRFEISVIGVIHRIKNQLQVIEALKYIPDSIKSNIHISIIGGCTDIPYGKMFEQKLKEESGDVITYRGKIAHDKMPSVYAESDLVLCCSKDDSLPVVIAEAITGGIPVMVSTGTGFASEIEDGCNGYVYDVSDARNLAEAIASAYEHRENRSKLASEAKVMTRDYYS